MTEASGRILRFAAARPASRPYAGSDGAVPAIALRAWQLQFELAWAYPRLCYALWSAVNAVPAGRNRTEAPADGD